MLFWAQSGFCRSSQAAFLSATSNQSEDRQMWNEEMEKSHTHWLLSVGVWFFHFVPGSQQQSQTVVTELLFETFGGHGGGIHQAGVCGAPVLRDQPDVPRQQGLELCMSQRWERVEETAKVSSCASVTHYTRQRTKSDLCSIWGRSASRQRSPCQCCDRGVWPKRQQMFSEPSWLGRCEATSELLPSVKLGDKTQGKNQDEQVGEKTLWTGCKVHWSIMKYPGPGCRGRSPSSEPRHFLLLSWGDTKAFPNQQTDIISLACPRSEPVRLLVGRLVHK